MMQPEPETQEPVRVLVVEDDQIYGSGLKAELKPFASEVMIVGEAANAKDALAKILDLTPSVILVDLRIPLSDRALSKRDADHGIGLISEIREMAPNTRMIALTNVRVEENPFVLYSAIRAGAHGYVPKEPLPAKTLRNIILTVAAGGFYFGAERSVIAQYLRDLNDLTPKQRETLDLLGAGLTNRQIEEEMNISEGTVKNHVGAVLGKLHVASRDDFLRYRDTLRQA